MVMDGPDSSVGIETHYCLEGPEIEFQWGRDFPHPYRPTLLYNGYRVSAPGIKRPEYGVDHPPQSSAEIKERVKLYISSSELSWQVLG